MADYWKSQPKKFCQYCKCWIADNKPSIEFHERGKNHKQNVAAKIEEIKKNSTVKAKKLEKMSKEFAAMEEAAMKAYEEDMKRLKAEAETPVQAQTAAQKFEVGDPAAGEAADPDSKRESDDWVRGTTDNGQIYYYNTITGESQWEEPEGFHSQIESSTTDQSENQSIWMEAMSPDGYMYYYNTETGESIWERPSEFSPKEGSQSETNAKCKVKSLSGKKAANSKEPRLSKINFRKKQEEVADLAGNDEKDSTVDDLQEEEKDGGGVESSAPIENKEPPAKKHRNANAYGNWEQIKEDENLYKNVDLQLPKEESGGSTSRSSVVPPQPKPKFKERAITSLGDESSLGAIFKKRKTENGKPRSLRQRGKDD